MSRASQHCLSGGRQGLTIVLSILVLSSVALATRHHWNTADPGSVGGIPYAGGPQSSSGITVPYLLTLGLVVDSARVSIPDVPVVVMSADGTIVATGITDDLGLFSVKLPSIAGLTVSLPMNGVNEVPIEAGVPVLIVVP